MIVPEGLFDNEPLLLFLMTWHPTGDKPLPELIMAHLNKAYTSIGLMNIRPF